jgi:hypothetical protein
MTVATFASGLDLSDLLVFPSADFSLALSVPAAGELALALVLSGDLLLHAIKAKDSRRDTKRARKRERMTGLQLTDLSDTKFRRK